MKNKNSKKTDDLTSYFFDERFTSPVSPLGWSILGPKIEKIALKQPLKYMGLFSEAKGDLIVLKDGFPMAKADAFRALFQIVPRKLITQDKLNSFLRKQDLKDFNFSFLFKHFPVLAANAIRDLNWFPFYHFYKWRRFKEHNTEFYEEFRFEDLTKRDNKELLEILQKLTKRTDKFLKLHRWSFVFSEVFYGMLKGLIRRWIPSKKIDEDIEIAEKLCSGFKENVTAQMDKELYELAYELSQREDKEFLLKNDERGKDILAAFISRFGHRSESLDIFYPTWREDPSFVIDIINANLLKIRSGKESREAETEETRLKTTRFCLDTIYKNSFFGTKRIKQLIFMTLLYISQNFMILREVQRDQWHRILSQKRRLILQIAQNLKSKNLIEDTNEIFFLKISELEKVIEGDLSKEKINNLISKRTKKTYCKVKEVTPPIIQQEAKDLKGLGVSRGIIKGRAVVMHTLAEMRKLKHGDILITKIIDSSWTPIFNVISGLVTEVGGMLSHGAVVARELGMPAIVGLKNATKKIPENVEIEINGKSGEVKVVDS
jgi:phosphohistidine swiveling domain-containing protein